jgi:hypothetical protein
MPMSQQKKGSSFDEPCGAEDEIRTRDPNLGKVVLYQLSYFCTGCYDVIRFSAAKVL